MSVILCLVLFSDKGKLWFALGGGEEGVGNVLFGGVLGVDCGVDGRAGGLIDEFGGDALDKVGRAHEVGGNHVFALEGLGDVPFAAGAEGAERDDQGGGAALVEGFERLAGPVGLAAFGFEEGGFGVEGGADFFDGVEAEAAVNGHAAETEDRDGSVGGEGVGVFGDGVVDDAVFVLEVLDLVEFELSETVLEVAEGRGVDVVGSYTGVPE